MLTVLIGFVGLEAVRDQETDYCLRKLCHRRKHIACNSTWQFDPDCPADRKLIKMTPKLRQVILKRHNELRNQLASGKMVRFDKALRMATMVWDEELEDLAELNVMTCKYSHDKCHSTYQFPKPGQNIARYVSILPFTPSLTESTCIKTIDLWWAEHKDTSKSDINCYPQYPRTMIGHFTCLAIESNWAVGCAVGTYKDGEYVFAITCNYARANIINEPIYSSGTNAASSCLKGTNPEFKALCTIDETYS